MSLTIRCDSLSCVLACALAAENMKVGIPALECYTTLVSQNGI